MVKTSHTAQEPSESTFLMKSKSDFRQELMKRIDDGKSILKPSVKNASLLAKVRKQFSMWNDYNLELLKVSFNKPDNEYRKNYSNAGKLRSSTLRKVLTNSEQEIKDFRYKFNSKLDNLEKLVQKIELLRSSQSDEMQMKNLPNQLDKSKIFIVHGHDNSVKIETARFIEKLGFEPIILHEQVSSGKTIIEKIEKYSNVGFGIVLYTPCDLGAKKGQESSLMNRARQNVVFEHGFLIGKIGRENVTALVKGNVETPNDISGVVYISMEEDWKLELAKELKNSGYFVDMNLVV